MSLSVLQYCNSWSGHTGSRLANVADTLFVTKAIIDVINGTFGGFRFFWLCTKYGGGHDDKIKALKEHLSQDERQVRDGEIVDDFSIDRVICELEKVALLDRVRPWFGSDPDALEWFNNEFLPLFGMTAAEVVNKLGSEGIEALNEYVTAREYSGFE